MNYIFGRKPVLEALKTDQDIQQVFIAFGQHGDVVNKIKSLATRKKIKVSETSIQRFKEIEKGQNSQGVIALIREHKLFELDDIIAASKKNEYPLLLLLDTIQDPHNLGAIIRTAECSGVDGIVMTSHNSADITETVEKTSAGAVSHIKICQVSNLNNAMKELKDEGFWIVGSSLETNKDHTDIDYKMPTAIVMGNEEKGLRKLIAENCDFLVRIPMKGKIQSLNVSVATGVLLFEVMRQRKLN